LLDAIPRALPPGTDKRYTSRLLDPILQQEQIRISSELLPPFQAERMA
jgi:hypothetical protein